MRTDPNRWASLFLFISVVFGAVVRFAPTVMAGSIINDGGMFYVMIADLKASRFVLPVFTSYNNFRIPFVYPPLSLYFGGLLSWMGVPTAEVLRWLPPLISSASIFAFYWLAALILNSRNKAALATMAYALMPRSFSWYVMGGGLSRAFGVFFLLLACASAWALFTQPAPKYVALTALFGAGTVLSHPETGLHAAAACALIWLFKGRSKRGIADAIMVAIGVIVLSSPWWAAALAQHGLGPFRSALDTGGHSGLFWVPWLTVNFAEEPFVTLLTVLGLTGLAIQAIRRDWFLPAWMLAAFAVEPRSAPAIAALPLAILAGCALSDFVIPNIALFAARADTGARDWTIHMSQSGVSRVVLGYVLFSAFLGAFAYDTNLASYVIPTDGLSAMKWIQDNTAPRSRFIVLTGSADPFADPTGEWFPALTSRTSENTIQGREWLLGNDFTPFLNSLEPLQACLNQAPACVEAWATANKAGFDYIYIAEPMDKASAQPSNLLATELRQDQGYRLAFQNGNVAIFARK